MIANYLKIMKRNLLKNKGFSLINIIGLSLGIACFILISMWVTNEISYDKFHKNIDRLYRVNTILPNGKILPNSSLKLGEEMQLRYPEIESYTNFIPWARSLLRYKDKSYDETGIYLVDPAFFTMFSFEFVAGNPSNPMPDIYSIVITSETAKKYFGNENPIGKRIYSNVFERDFIVTAVVKKMPSNSTLQFNIAGSVKLMPLQRRESWEFSGWTYVMLGKNVSEAGFNKKIEDFYEKYVDAEWKASPKLQNYATLHLYEDGESGLAKLVYIFSGIAIFILLVACANFMNLSTAKASQRSREVGIRKVNGARKFQLIIQFIGESVFISFIAALVAVFLVSLALPTFNAFTGKSMTLFENGIINSVLWISVLILFTGMLAGIYPAFVLSSFKPMSVLKSANKVSGNRGLFFRKFITINQFIISISLIICTLLVKSQMDYVHETDIGMNREMVITLPNNVELMKNFDTYKSELLSNTNVINVSASATQPFDVNQNIAINWEGHMDEEAVSMRYTMVDYDFFKTLGIKLTRGRAFSPNIQTDSTEAILINESAASLMGFDNPIGKTVYFGHPAFPEEKRLVKIIGVVKDFHFLSLHSPMGPFVFRMHRPWHFNIFAKLRMGNTQQALTGIKNVTKKFAPDYPFKYEFLDDTYDKMYLMETKISQLFNVFAGLAIIISCLGLFGLATYTAEQKTKEIGIRKVLGASIASILLLLSKRFIAWVIIASIISIPVTYYFMNNWLQSFAYRIDINWWVFALAGLIALVIALATVSIQAIKAAVANPVEALRYE